MLQNDKICFLGMPRCGSQYIMELIAVNGKYENLHEPFTGNHPMSIDIINNNIKTIFKTPFNNYNEQILYVTEKLNFKFKNSRVILKFFPNIDKNSCIYNLKLIDWLKQSGFILIHIERSNIEKHLISWLVAKKTGVWYKNKYIKETGDINDIILGDITDDANFFVNTFINFKEVLTSIDPLGKLPRIRYEHALDDIKNIFGFETLKEIRSAKILPVNPYEKIINSDEIKSKIELYLRLIKNENYTGK